MQWFTHDAADAASREDREAELQLKARSAAVGMCVAIPVGSLACLSLGLIPALSLVGVAAIFKIAVTGLLTAAGSPPPRLFGAKSPPEGRHTG